MEHDPQLGTLPPKWANPDTVPPAGPIPPTTALTVAPVFFIDGGVQDILVFRSFGSLFFDLMATLVSPRDRWDNVHSAHLTRGSRAATTPAVQSYYMFMWLFPIARAAPAHEVCRLSQCGYVRAENRVVSLHCVHVFFSNPLTQAIGTGSEVGINTTATGTVAHYLGPDPTYAALARDVREDTNLLIVNMLSVRTLDRRFALGSASSVFR